ncbi:hypothetical protein C1X72_25735 [Pseudomonas sp. FW306-2-2C-D06B]|uniref:AbiTii domain-containing protein n=1 Tax=unclassified Pseudomonas TaxID=196821 RepID=UPI000C88EC91|nr:MULTISPECIES: hypothetical protein [unclassified Pseudomonas]PMY78359.1 hypothetical protein C1X72_25735 [Pseudomonas sp. FW306-2-2C-D06B]
MDSLVLELQRDALDRNIHITDLLRKALLVSRKLKIKDLEEWLNGELNGYDSSLVPDYRQVSGELKVFNPYNGWNPVMLTDKQWQDLLCTRKLEISISQIENLVENSKGGAFLIKFPAEQAKIIMELIGRELEPALHASLHQLVLIIDSVKTKIMEFALDLESRGILGENMTFSKQEQQLAETITYNTINIHSMENSQIQQANAESDQIAKLD